MIAESDGLFRRSTVLIVILFLVPAALAQVYERKQIAEGRADVNAGQADGSDDPGCPPAQCADIIIEHIPAWKLGGELKIDKVEAFVFDLNGGRRNLWQSCPEAKPGLGTFPRWECKYARFYKALEHIRREPGGNEWTYALRIRNWASYGRRAKVRVSYWTTLAR